MQIKKYLPLFFILSFTISFSQNFKTGVWRGNLILSEKDTLSFQLTVQKKGFQIKNGTEQIYFESVQQSGDSIIAKFQQANALLIIKKWSSTDMYGYWTNLNKVQHKVDFFATFGCKTRFNQNNTINTNTLPFAGKWKINFQSTGSKDQIALGYFEGKTVINGSFLTETGDYGCLAGNQFGTKIYLSNFDGSRAYLFQGVMKGDSIKGTFYSGKNYIGTWNGVKDDQFALRNPYEITTIKTNDASEIRCINFNQDTIQPLQLLKGKVVIIQIMGTWCPNCIDETTALNQLYAKYHSKGLEIVAISFENGTTSEGIEKLKRFQLKRNVAYSVYYGGKTGKGVADQVFPMIDGVKSYPTTLYIDKNGKIIKTYTGFYGPGTGSYYENYLKETELFLKELLK